MNAIRTLARTTIWVILGLAVILLAGMCNSRVGAQGPAGGQTPDGPALVSFHSRIQTEDRVTYVYALTTTGTVARLTIDGPCLLDTGGLAVRYNGAEQITLLETGFTRGLDGAKITVKYAPTVYTVVGFWVSAEYPGGLAANSRWAMFPLDAYTEGNPTPYVQTVPQCDASPTVLPLVTAGPAEPGPTVVILIAIILIFAAWSNARSRPRPPHR